jgi:sortase (surface protein transpeptidase)
MTGSQRRRLQVAVLALAGTAVVAPVVAVAVGRPPQGTQLDAHAQYQRVLPTPGASAVVAKKSPRKKARHARHVWKQMPRPVRVLIPAIGASAPVIPLGLNRDGTMQTPNNVTDTGWFQPGPEPGEKGAAVIVGHVDSHNGPGVFFHLPALRRGDRIVVVLRGGKRLQFMVTSTRQVLKVRFPTKLVFAHTPNSTLRLVTCGGRFNPATGHYLDNNIVFARLVGHP